MAIVHGAPDVIPDLGLDLPFIDQPRGRPDQYQGGIDTDRATRIRIDVEKDLARGNLPGRGGLTARLGPFDDHRTADTQSGSELGVDNAWVVGHQGRCGRVTSATATVSLT